MMGVGGAVVMIPAIFLLAGINQHSAQGSSLLAMIPAGISEALTHWRFGNIDRSLVKRLIPGIFIGTFLDGVAAHYFTAEWILRMAFGLLVLWTSFRFFKNGVIVLKISWVSRWNFIICGISRSGKGIF
jgi:uncharacterized membrane protein YfcA